MPATPAVRDSIAAIRMAMSTLPQERAASEPGLSLAIFMLGQRAEEIAGNPKLMGDVLLVAAEIEAFRGAGSKPAARSIATLLGYIITQVSMGLPEFPEPFDSFPSASKGLPTAAALLKSLEMLADRAFTKVHGPAVRSHHAARLRSEAWAQLAAISEVVREPAHLAYALKVAADKRASPDEREAAIGFLPEYWGGDGPDEATAALLKQVQSEPPSREFLVTVLKVQIDLGLNDEFGALSGLDDWGDENEE